MPFSKASWLLSPYHAAALATGAKSFRDNPFIGSERLNRLGLHVTRMRVAARMAAHRRDRLAASVEPRDIADFARDGYIVKQDFLPRRVFETLRREVTSMRAPARDMKQGDAITRRIALDAANLHGLDATSSLIEDRRWLNLIRYIGSSDLAPRLYVQTIFSRVCDTAVDPQTLLHADTFHSTVKAWFFITDVAEEDGPFIYVPGSHRLTARRLAWERRGSITATRANFLTSRGSPRIDAEGLSRLGLGPPRVFSVPANTLIVADTMGFHARGRSRRPSTRIELWAYGRRNPFLPWTGFDPAAAPIIRDHIVSWTWRGIDLRERLGLGRNPWRQAGIVQPDTPPNLDLFDR